MKRIRMFLLSLAAVSSMLVTGNVFAGGELERLPEERRSLRTAHRKKRAVRRKKRSRFPMKKGKSFLRGASFTVRTVTADGFTEIRKPTSLRGFQRI